MNTLTSATTTTVTVDTPFSGYQDASSTITTYFILNGTLVGAYTYQKGNEASTGKLTFAHTNYLGTPVLETDDKGDIVQMDITDVFGNYVQRDQRKDNAYHNKGYTGHEYDDTTGLNYVHARFMDVKMHSFLSVDPLNYSLPQSYLLDPQQLNTYSYGRNNPVVFVDMDGQKVYAIAKAIEGASFGTHVFLYIVPDNSKDFGVSDGEGWTLGGYAGDSGNLVKAKNAPSDYSVVMNGYSIPDQKVGALKSRVEVVAPSGVSDTQFIKNISAQYDSYKQDAKYDAFTNNGYNSNNLATTILKNSGVSNLPWKGNAPGIDPGYGTSIPTNYTKNTNTNTKSQSLPSAVSTYSSRETTNKASGVMQNIGNQIKNNATKVWNWIKGK